MKKTIFALILLSVTSTSTKDGLIINFMKKQDDALKLASSQDIAATVIGVVGATALGASGYHAASPQPHVRTFLPDPGFSVLSSPYLWFALGGVAATFAVYQFIGHEMGIIIETKSTLLALEKQIQLWEKQLPLLKEHQNNLEAKMKNALKVLDTVMPLVVKLAKNSETDTIHQQVDAIKQEIAGLKELVKAFGNAPGTTTLQELNKKSHSLFGFGKKKPKVREN